MRQLDIRKLPWPVGLGKLTELFGGEPQPLLAVLGELKATGAVKELGPVAE